MTTESTDIDSVRRWTKGPFTRAVKRIIILCVHRSNVYNWSLIDDAAFDKAKAQARELTYTIAPEQCEHQNWRASKNPYDPVTWNVFDNWFDEIVAGYKARAAKKHVPSITSLLSFVCLSELQHVIPATELEGKHKVTYKELGYILKTIRRLLIGGNSKLGKTIPYSYFLGKAYAKNRKVKAPKVPKFDDPTSALEGFLKGIEYAEKQHALKSKQKVNNYPQQYKKGTGRTLTVQKLTRIIQLLERHEFLIIAETSNGKLKHGVKAFKCGPRIKKMDLW